MDSLIASCGLLLVAAWLVPLKIPPWSTSHSDMVAAAALVALALAGLARRRAAHRLVLPGPALFLIGLALVPVVQVALGKIVFAGDGLIASLYLVCAACAVIWSARIAEWEAERWSRTLATALLAGALLSAVVALLQRFDVVPVGLRLYITDLRPGDPPGANLAQPNQLVTLLGLGLAALMLLFEQGRTRKTYALAGAAILAVTMAATESRTSLLLFIAGGLGLTLWCRRLSLRTRPTVGAGLGLLWAIAYVGWPHVASAIDLTPLRASLASRAHLGPRAVIWQQIWEAIWQQPWTGYGWNQVSNAQVAVVAAYPDSRLIEHSHNLLLDLLVWNGVPIGALIIVLTTVWLWRMQARVRSVAGVFGLLVIALLLAHAMVEFPLEYLYFLVPFGMAVGIVGVDAGLRATLTMPRGAGALLVAAQISLLAWLSVDYLNVESAYRQMRFAVARFGQPMPATPPPLLQTPFTQLAAQHRAWLTTPHVGMSPAEVRLLVRVSERYGYAPLLYRQALAQAMNGDIEGARAALLRLRNMHRPQYIEAAMGEIRHLAATEHPELRPLLLR